MAAKWYRSAARRGIWTQEHLPESRGSRSRALTEHCWDLSPYPLCHPPNSCGMRRSRSVSSRRRDPDAARLSGIPKIILVLSGGC